MSGATLRQFESVMKLPLISVEEFKQEYEDNHLDPFFTTEFDNIFTEYGY